MPQRPTSADVATEAGRVPDDRVVRPERRSDMKIPEETRAPGPRCRASELGYHPHAPARQLAGGRSHILALVLRQSPEQIAGDAVLAETLRGLAAAARAGGFRVMVEPMSPGRPDGRSYAALLRAQHADGLVISGPRVDDPSLDRAGPRRVSDRAPGRPAGRRVASVDVDNVAGARGAVEHLVVAGPSPDRLHHQRPARLHGRPGAPGWLPPRAGGGRSRRRARAGGRAARSTPRAATPRWPRCSTGTTFDAVFVASDVVALGAIGAHARGGPARAGRHQSIVGFDDIPLAAYFDPPLTTVRLPAYELGQAAGRALLERIADRRRSEPDAAPDRAHRARLDGSADAALTDAVQICDRRCTRARRRTRDDRDRPGRGESAWRTDRPATRCRALAAVIGAGRSHARPGARAARRCGIDAGQRAGGQRQRGREPRRIRRPDRRRGLRHRDVDRRRTGVVPGHGRSRGRSRPASRSSTPARATSTPSCRPASQSGMLPDVAGLPGPGPDGGVRPGGRPQAPRTASSTSTAYKADTAPALVDARDGRRQARRHLHQGRRQGPDLVQHRASTTTARPSTTWDDLLAKGQRRPPGSALTRQTLVRRPRVRRGHRLAGHRLDRGLRPRRQRPGGLRRVGRRHSRSGPRPRSRRRSRRSAASSPTRSAAARTPSATNFGDAGNPLFTEPARLPLPPPGELHHRLLQEDRRRDGRRVRLLPVPDDRTRTYAGASRAPATCSACSTTRRRPVADRLPGHARSPGRSGSSRGGALSANKKVDDLPGRDPAEAPREVLADAKTFRFDGGDLMPQAMQDAFFNAHPRLRPGPVQARRDPGQARRRPGDAPTRP